MVAENSGRNIPSLNRLLYRTSLGSMIMFAFITVWEYFADPDPFDGGSLLFYGLVLLLCLGVQWTMYKLKLHFLLKYYPALISNILGVMLFYVFFFMKQPVLLFGVALFILSALSWHWITTYRE